MLNFQSLFFLLSYLIVILYHTKCGLSILLGQKMIKKVMNCAVFRKSKPNGEHNKIDAVLGDALRCRGLISFRFVFLTACQGCPGRGRKNHLKVRNLRNEFFALTRWRKYGTPPG